MVCTVYDYDFVLNTTLDSKGIEMLILQSAFIDKTEKEMYYIQHTWILRRDAIMKTLHLINIIDDVEYTCLVNDYEAVDLKHFVRICDKNHEKNTLLIASIVIEIIVRKL